MGAGEQGSKGAEIYHMTIISNQELKREQGSNGATEQWSSTISYVYTFKILTKNCKWEQGSKGAREQDYIIYQYFLTKNCKREQGSKGAELYHMTIISNQELGAREQRSN